MCVPCLSACTSRWQPSASGHHHNSLNVHHTKAFESRWSHHRFRRGFPRFGAFLAPRPLPLVVAIPEQLPPILRPFPVEALSRPALRRKAAVSLSCVVP
jgi:hypothetical protein